MSTSAAATAKSRASFSVRSTPATPRTPSVPKRAICESDTSIDGQEDNFFDKASFKIIVHEVVDSFKDLSKKKIIINDDEYKKDYLITKKIEIIYSLKNIIDNALKFSSDKIEIFLLSNEEQLRIKVEDDGVGFSKQILGFLGDPYINKKDLDKNKEGLGLGIFIAKVFLERLSAIINFYNLEGKGAVVDISWQKKDLINLKLI